MLPLNDEAVRHYIQQKEFTLALEVLMQQYQGPILRYCYCHLLNHDSAQEVAQDVFIAAFERMAELRKDSSLNAWLYGIATNKCLEKRRNSSRRELLCHHNSSLIGQYVHCTPPPSLEDGYILETQRRRVWQALQRLRVYERQLVVLRYLEELTYDEIASIVRVSSRTVERHLPRALSKFFKAYERCEKHAISRKSRPVG